MAKQGISYKLSLLLFAILFLLTLFEISCKYKGFTIKEFTEAAHFGYPSTYKIQEVDKTPDLGAIVVGLKFSKTDTLIGIFAVSVMKPNEQFPDVNSLLEYHLNVAKKEQLSDEFKLIEKTPISVGGAQGEKVVYYRMRSQSPSGVEQTGRIPEIAYEAFFKNNGYLWEIGVHTNIDDSDQAKADFEYIIKTFKFLD